MPVDPVAVGLLIGEQLGEAQHGRQQTCAQREPEAHLVVAPIQPEEREEQVLQHRLTKASTSTEQGQPPPPHDLCYIVRWAKVGASSYQQADERGAGGHTEGEVHVRLGAGREAAVLDRRTGQREQQGEAKQEHRQHRGHLEQHLDAAVACARACVTETFRASNAIYKPHVGGA